MPDKGLMVKLVKYTNPAVAAVFRDVVVAGGDVVVIRELDNNFKDVEFVKAGAAFPKVMKR